MTKHLASPIWKLAAIFLVCLPLAGCKSAMPIVPEPVDVAVEHLLWAVDEAAAQSMERYRDELDLRLSKIEIALETIVTTTDTGEVAVFVVTLEGSREKISTQIVTVDLAPPNDEKPRSTWPPSPHGHLVRDLSRGFDAAILAARGVREGLQALDSGTETGSDGYTTDDIVVELEFALENTLEGSVTVDILDVDLTLGRTRVKENIHTIKLVFKPASTSENEKAGEQDEAHGESKARDRRREKDG